jgi:DNA anti-recombination protein RmuC
MDDIEKKQPGNPIDEDEIDNKPEVQEVYAKLRQMVVDLQKSGERLAQYKKEREDAMEQMRTVMHDAATEIQRATVELDQADKEAAEEMEKITDQFEHDMAQLDAEEEADEAAEENEGEN